MRLLLFLFALVPLNLPAQNPLVDSVDDLPIKTIGIIRDQKSPHFDALIVGFIDDLKSSRFDALIEALLDDLRPPEKAKTPRPIEARDPAINSSKEDGDDISKAPTPLLLSEEQYRLRVIELKPSGNRRVDVEQALSDAFDNPEIDVIFTAGIVSSDVALKLEDDKRTKPVIAGNMEFSDLSDSLTDNEKNKPARDGQGISTSNGSSITPNYSFVRVPKRIETDLKSLSSLADTKTIDILVERHVIESLEAKLTKDVNQFEETHGINVQIVPISTYDLSLSNLSSNTRAVYVPLLPSFTPEQRASLFSTLAQKQRISFSMLGPEDVEERGAFACLAPKIAGTLHRRLALNLHQALLGIDTFDLPVDLNLANQLRVNLVTARQIGWSPDYDTSLEANLFGQEQVRKSSGNLTLASAMAMAAKLNPNVKSAKAAWQSSLADVLSGKAQFSTTASLVGQAGGQMNRNRTNSLLTPQYAGSTSLGVEVNRLLYSDQLYQQIEALGQQAEAVRLDSQSIIYDTVETTAQAYLDTLLAEEIYKIQKDNLNLVQENLGLAEIRYKVGASDKTDTYRWEASKASSRSALISADSNRKNARTALNVQLATDSQKHWDLKDIEIANNESYFLQDTLGDMVNNQKQFHGFIRFIRALASANSPEIQSFDFNLRAEGIRLVERMRRQTRPQVSLNAGVRQIFENSDITSSGSPSEWTVGIGFTLPFLETDLRRADVSKIEAGIDQLQAQRERAIYLVEQRALVACYNMAASHPAMRLSREALKASKQNYDIVREQYSLGEVNVVTLIDAQTNLFNQRQAVENAIYTYLKDAISLQRAIAWFEFSKTEKEVSEFNQRYRDFQKTGSVHVRVIKK